MALMRVESMAKQTSGVTAIAVDKDKNSQNAVKWAADNLFINGNALCVLLHVQVESSVSEDSNVSNEGRSPTKDESKKYFLPYRGFLARKGIEVKEVVLQGIDIPSALVCYIINNSIGSIVVGACNRNLLLRKFRLDVASRLIKAAPESCAVYVISSHGKVQSSRSSNQPQLPQPRSRSEKGSPNHSQSHISSSPDASMRNTLSCNSWRSEGTDRSSCSSENSEKSRLKSTSGMVQSMISMDSLSSNSITKPASDRSDLSQQLSSQSEMSEIFDFSSSSSQSAGGMEAEIRRLRRELKLSIDVYASVCKEAVEAKGKAMELEQWKNKEAQRIEEAKVSEEAALALAESERQKAKAAMEAAEMAQLIADLEAQKRKIAKKLAKRQAKERKNTLEVLAQTSVRYRKYNIEEIETATDHFSDSLKIGEGGYGPVYKTTLDHTDVAIKVLRPNLSEGLKQFKQEIDVLSSMRHPNMVLLLGACPDYGCLVYEYMENGSLEDRLYRKDNSPSIPWRTRFKIAVEIATGLLFLHQNKPEPLVHRDLKPANILLNKEYVSKIADVGLARLVPPSVADSVTQYHMTAAAGTFCYIDPEYQQTGMLGVKSDLYSLGVVLLQIITARRPMGLSHQVEMAIEDGKFSEILDPTVTDWPIEEALSFAKLGLRCCELRKRDRPDLASIVLPELSRLRDIGLESQ